LVANRLWVAICRGPLAACALVLSLAQGAGRGRGGGGGWVGGGGGGVCWAGCAARLRYWGGRDRIRDGWRRRRGQEQCSAPENAHSSLAVLINGCTCV